MISSFVTYSIAGRNFYKILGVSKTASDNEIKSAFRKLAVDLHPDKNLDDKDATKKFQDVREAFEVLSDKEKRKIYDEGGEEKLKKMGKESGMNPFESFGFPFDFMGGMDPGNKETPRGADITFDLYATYEELYVGKIIQLKRIKPIYKVSKGTRECNCRQKMITRQVGPGQIHMMQTTECDQCPNMELSTQEKTLEFEIEKGMNDGSTQKFHGEGEPHIDGDSGDMIVRVRTSSHPIFERRGDDLFTNATITLTEALTGFSLSLKHLDGHIVTINRDKVTWPGAKIRKAGEGMPNYNNNQMKGVLFVTFDVDFPRGELSIEDQEAVKKILSNYKTDSIDENSNSIDNPVGSDRFYNGLRGY